MAVRFLISVDLGALDSNGNGGLDFKTACFLHHIYLSVSATTLDKAFDFLKDHYSECVVYLNVISLENVQDILRLLDNGAAKVMITPEQRTKLREDHDFNEPERVIVSFDRSELSESRSDLAAFGKTVKHRLHPYHAIFISNFSDDITLGGSDVISSLDYQCLAYTLASTHTVETYLKTIQRPNHIPIIPAQALTSDHARNPELIPVELLVTHSIRSDRSDGLYPTIVTNEHEVCLGLVYSSNESISASLKTGKGIYKSRKRNGLWVKGDTSGDYQDLVKIDWDCDGDALRFVVWQRGDGTVGPSC